MHSVVFTYPKCIFLQRERLRVIRDINIFVVVDLMEGSCWYDDDFEEDASVLIRCPFPH